MSSTDLTLKIERTYDAPIEGTSAFRYYRDPALGPEYEAAMDALFTAYSQALISKLLTAPSGASADDQSPRM